VTESELAQVGLRYLEREQVRQKTSHARVGTCCEAEINIEFLSPYPFFFLLLAGSTRPEISAYLYNQQLKSAFAEAAPEAQPWHPSGSSLEQMGAAFAAAQAANRPAEMPFAQQQSYAGRKI
jgi:hypothetical protein